MEQMNQDTPLKRQIWISFFILLSIGLILAGLFYYRVEKNRIRQEKYDEIASVAGLKVKQIESWRAERLEDVRVLSRSLFTRKAILELVKSPASAQLRNEVQEQLALEDSLGLYSAAFVLDNTGRTLVSIGAPSTVMDTSDRDAFHEAVSDRRAILTDLFREPSGMAHIDAMDAILDESGKPAAVVLLRSDADSFLYPLIDAWPTPSRSAETLLSEKRGNGIIFLNSLLFNPSAAFSLRIPLTSTTTPAVQAVLGKVGMFEGKDYRGEEVLADLRPVPNTPWFMVAKVNTNEILSEANYRGGVVILLVVLFVIISIIATAYAYRNRQAGIYRKMYYAELERKRAEEVLESQHTLLAALIESATDTIIFSLDKNYCYTAFNAKHREEMKRVWNTDIKIGMNLLDCMQIPELRELAKRSIDRALHGESFSEVQHQPEPDLYYEFGWNPIYQHKEIVGVTSFVRDITERKRAEEALNISETRYRRLFESAKDGILILDAETGMIVDVNPFLIEMLGYSHEQFLGKEVWELGFLKDVFSNREKFLELQQKGYARYEDLPLQTADGRLIDVEFVSNVYLMDHKKVVQCNIRNISERKNAEIALHESQQMLRTVLDTIPARVFWKDRNGIFLGCNLPFAKDSGFSSSEDIVGKDDFQMGWREQAQLYRTDDRQVIESGTPKIAYEEPQSFDKGIRWLRTSKVPLRNAKGEAIGVLGTYEDVTEAKQATLLLAHERYLLNALLDNTVDAIYFKDTEGRFTRVSATMAAKRGLTNPDQLIGKTDFDFFMKERAQEIHEQEQEIIRTQKPVVDVEIQELWTDRPPTWVSVTKVPLYDKAGKIIGTFGISRDITGRKRTEEALRKNEKQYRLLAESSPEMIYLVGTDGRLSYVNGRAASELHSSPQELVGKHLTEIFPASVAARNLQGLQRVITTKSASQTELVQEFPAGDKWIDARLCPVFDDDGQVVAVLGLSNDITERKRTEETLRENENRMRTIVEGTPHLFFYTQDTQGRITYTSPSVETITGRSIDEWRSQSHWFITKNKINDYARELTQAHLRGEFTKGPVLVEVEHADQHAILLEVYENPIITEGKVTGLQGVAHDITERRQTEQALRESEEKYRRFFEDDLSGDYISTPQGKILDCNQAFAMMMGFSSVEAVLNSSAEAFYAQSSDRQAFLDRLRREKRLFNCEEILVRQDGQSITVLENVIGRFDGQGELVSLQGYIFDITERKRAEDALRESEEKFRGLVEGSASGILIHDIKHFIYVNAAALSMTGYTAEEVYQLAPRDIIHPDFRELVMKRAEDRIKGRKVPEHYEYQILKKSGEVIWVDFSTSVIEYQGKPSLIASAYDITDRKKLQEQLIQAQKMEGIGKLAGGVAHDYNNMLGVIIGYSDLIMKKVNKSEPLYRYSELIASAAKRAADITRQLLAFARREIVSPHVLDPNKAIESLHKMLQRLIGENVKLRFLPEKSVWNIKIDPTQLDQILVNLATNARDAIDDVGTITIETSNVSIDEGYARNQIDLSPGEYMMISFTDTGKGMSKEVMGRIFEPFFTTKSKGQGTGLGLSTVYGIVKQNGGSINVYSELSIGTTLRIYLPRYQGEVEEPEAVQTENAISGNETVLVVEDQADLLELAKNSLEEYGYKVLTALSPGEGILLCETYQGKIHVLLTDVVMPVMNGKELRDKILAMKPDIKTVFMSGYTADVIAIRGVLDEEVEFIQKPFTPYALAKKVHDVSKS